jgi:hypothetical protein
VAGLQTVLGRGVLAGRRLGGLGLLGSGGLAAGLRRVVAAGARLRLLGRARVELHLAGAQASIAFFTTAGLVVSLAPAKAERLRGGSRAREAVAAHALRERGGTVVAGSP